MTILPNGEIALTRDELILLADGDKRARAELHQSLLDNLPRAGGGDDYAETLAGVAEAAMAEARMVPTVVHAFAWFPSEDAAKFACSTLGGRGWLALAGPVPDAFV